MRPCVRAERSSPAAATTANAAVVAPRNASNYHHQRWYQGFLTLSFDGCCFWFSIVLLANV